MPRLDLDSFSDAFTIANRADAMFVELYSRLIPDFSGTVAQLQAAYPAAQNIGKQAYTTDASLQVSDGVSWAAVGEAQGISLAAAGGGASKTAAQNDTAFALALSYGQNVYLPPMNVGEYVNVSVPIYLPSGLGLYGAGIQQCTLRQRSNDMPIVRLGSAKHNLSHLGMTYETQQTSVNAPTGYPALEFGIVDHTFLSRFSQVAISKCWDGCAKMGSNGEFQNNFDGFYVYDWRNIGMKLTGGTGSVYNNIRLQNSGPKPATADCLHGIYLDGYEGFTFNMLNIENVRPSGNMIRINNQSSGVFNAVHFEQWMADSAYSAGMLMGYQSDVTMNNLSITFSDFTRAAQDNIGFGMIAHNAARFMLNGFLEHDNTFDATYKVFFFNSLAPGKVHVRGWNARNSTNMNVVQRDDIVQFEDLFFNAGLVANGLSGTAPPTGGMPAPFRGVTGTALPWVQGDYCQKTNVAATGPAGYHCVVAGSPGTWMADPSSSVYTPTLTNVANLSASTAYECQYSRVGNTVTVSGRVDVDPTTTLTSTQLGISLPIASNFGATEDCAGVAYAPGIAAQGAGILADATNDRAQMQWMAADVTNQAMYFTFTYQVI